jgi:TPR repeat protein
VWFQKAANQGNAGAQNSLGVAYMDGQGVTQDYTQALAWLRKGAEQGDAMAQYNLGSMYSTGRGVSQDYVEAHKWHNLAASRAFAFEQKRYAEARDALAKLMTPQQLAEAQKRASEWSAAFEKRKQ